jgi:replicative DNA helicase Mcm
MATTPQDTTLVDDLTEFLRRYYSDELGDLAAQYPTDKQSIHIDWLDLVRFDPDIADDLRERPDQVIEYLEEAVGQYDLPVDVDLSGVQVCIENLSEEDTHTVGKSRVQHRNSLVGVRGQISRRSDAKPKATTLTFVCQRCGTDTTIPQAGDSRQEPHECPGCERQGPFEIDFDQSEFVNFQAIRVQQPPELAARGEPSSLDVHVQQALLDAVDAGDRVTVTGIYRLLDDGSDELTFDTYLEGTGIEPEETDFEDIDVEEYADEIERIASGELGAPVDVLVENFCPKITGHDPIKQAIVLQLFSANSATDATGNRERGMFHILIVGDPGKGKSRLLNAAAELAPRATSANGQRTSAAGITAGAVRDDFGDAEFSLKAGALVLGDQGICCIDEIDKVDDEALSAIHGAMSEGQVEVTNIMNATLPARTSVLAAGNPTMGRFDKYEPIPQQIDLAPPMLSRFDLVFTLVDDPDLEHDAEVAGHMLAHRQSAIQADKRGDAPADWEPEVSQEAMRAYIAYARQEINPTIPEEIQSKIQGWYAELRQTGGDGDDSPVAVTPRYVDAVQRLCEASARARLSETVEATDLDRAMNLINRSLRDVALDPETGEMDVDRLETGQSTAQRDRVRSILDLIEELDAEYNGGAPHEVLVDRAEEVGIDREKTQHELQQLKQKGDVYEPQPDYYRTS